MSSGEWFKTETEALNYARQEGCKVSQGKFNKDKKSGEVLICDGKKIAKHSVEKYIRLNTSSTAAKVYDLEKLASQKYEAETKSAIAKAEIDQLKVEEIKRQMDKHWLHRDEAWEQMAGIFGQLVQSLHRHLLASVPSLIHLCGGDPARGPELYEGVEESVIKACNEVVSMGKIEGMFTVQEED